MSRKVKEPEPELYQVKLKGTYFTLTYPEKHVVELIPYNQVTHIWIAEGVAHIISSITNEIEVPLSEKWLDHMTKDPMFRRVRDKDGTIWLINLTKIKLLRYYQQHEHDWTSILFTEDKFNIRIKGRVHYETKALSN